MTLNPAHVCATLALTLIAYVSSAQEKRMRTFERRFQFSLFPGISTNGIASGFYFNKYSFNLLGGLSAGNRYLEAGFLTNSHFQSSTGFQFAGLANITGTNAYVNLTRSEERSMIHNGFEVNNYGIQIAGILNYVLNHSKGIQVSGGFNHVGDDYSGVQIAGIGNSVGGFSQGVHIAGFYNLAKEAVAGLQVTTLFNYTDGQLSGTQLALINKARWMKGRNSTPATSARSLQIGLINFSKEMHGTQIGLINFGGEARGKQLGLINFYRRQKSKENADAGTPVGFLNFGSTGSVFRFHFNEIFPFNLEYTTGNCQNCTWTPAGPIGMPYLEQNKKMNQNALIVSVDPFRDTWGYGWGFQKILYNKRSIRPFDQRNEKRMITYGIRFLQLNRSMTIDRDLNLVTRVNFDWGRKKKFFYWYLGVAVNYMVSEETEESDFLIQSFEIRMPRLWGKEGRIWPGYTFGIQI